MIRRARIHEFALAAAVFTAAPACAEGQRASFIDGVYAMEGRCEKVAALAAGGPKNVETVPETLTSEGFRSWEGGCDFILITEKEKGRVYEAQMSCIEGPEEWTETDTFTIDSATGAITVSVEGDEHRFVKCGS
jgi:hypothetical protein